MLFGLFSPGPGTGYLFVLANLSMIAVLCFIGLQTYGGILTTSTVGGRWPNNLSATVFLILGLSYVAIYLGIGKLLIAAAHKSPSSPCSAAS